MPKHDHTSIVEKHEETLETIGVMLEEGEATVSLLQEKEVTALSLDKLVESNHIVIEDGQVHFLPKGEREFLSLIRRHRLTERLLHDVLDFTDEDGSEAIICKMEHILTEDFADAVCTLLGHPTVCPHNKPIPRGRCCIQKQDRIRPPIIAVDRLKEGEGGAIAFISTADSLVMDRLASMGIVPGLKIKLMQKKPAIVIKFEETILSMDEEYASAIFIRRHLEG